MIVRKCENCYWYEHCLILDIPEKEMDACDDYTPLDDSEIVEREYKEDLQYRSEYYSDYIKEQQDVIEES